MFQVAVRHGQGHERSQYYKVGMPAKTEGLAQLRAELYAEDHPEHDGWNVDIVVIDLDDDDNVVRVVR